MLIKKFALPARCARLEIVEMSIEHARYLFVNMAALSTYVKSGFIYFAFEFNGIGVWNRKWRHIDSLIAF